MNTPPEFGPEVVVEEEISLTILSLLALGSCGWICGAGYSILLLI